MRSLAVTMTGIGTPETAVAGADTVKLAAPANPVPPKLMATLPVRPVSVASLMVRMPDPPNVAEKLPVPFTNTVSSGRCVAALAGVAEKWTAGARVCRSPSCLPSTRMSWRQAS